MIFRLLKIASSIFSFDTRYRTAGISGRANDNVIIYIGENKKDRKRVNVCARYRGIRMCNHFFFFFFNQIVHVQVVFVEYAFSMLLSMKCFFFPR